METVYEHGEFAVRGALLDLFPMGSDTPYRIDLFDDEIETLRTFDPESQRSVDKVESIRLLPGREFPLDDLAAAGSMLARCAGDKALPMVDVLFEKQDEWVTRNDPVSKLFEIAKQAGFTKESFEKCLGDDKLLDAKARVDELKLKMIAVISLVTVPAGAAVSVDGNLETGTSPLTLKLQPGPHKITVGATGFETKEIDLEAKAGDKGEQRIELTAKPAPPPPPPPAPVEEDLASLIRRQAHERQGVEG